MDVHDYQLKIFNGVQTQFTEKFLSKLTKEEYDTMVEYLDSVQFIKNLISVDRKRASELDRWDNPNSDMIDEEGQLARKVHPLGKIRVNIENPHILEDMDYFRQAALHFEEHGVYTFLRPSSNPYSDYRKFWDEEIYRCWYGMVRESDGEWITGYHYWYLNYCPIKKSKKAKGSNRILRVIGLPDIYDGDYLFFHYIERARENGKHCGVLKKRGAGYSLKGAGMLSRNFIVGENEEVQTGAVSLGIANEKEYLIKDGILNKFIDVIDFTGKHTPFPSTRDLKDSFQAMHWQMGRKNTETNSYEGSLNEVIGVTLKNDPEKARGKRAIFILWEEFGKFDASVKAWNIGRPSVEDGEDVFGQMVFWGTGGTATEAFAGLRELFFKPLGYNIYPLNNVWDKNTKEGSTCSFFHPGYLNQSGYMDENGNSDVIGSLLSVVKKRILIKYNSNDSGALPQMVSEMACTPQEAIMKVSGNVFPVNDIKEYLEESRINYNTFVSDNLVGDLIINGEGTVDFITNFEKHPIRTYKRDKNNEVGAVEIFQKPIINPVTRTAYGDRYIAGIDPVDQDFILNGSLASIIVFDTWTDEIVAEYTGRPMLAEEFYETCRRLLLYYNAIGNYENNIKGLFGYFNGKSSLHLLCDTPRYLSDVQESRQRLFGNSSKGTRTTPKIILDGLMLQRSYMLSPHINVNSEGEEIRTIKLRTIKSLGYLEEAYEFNIDGNFDRVSAMNMVMILRQERINITSSILQSNEDASDPYEEDEFIRLNYNNKNNNEIVKNKKYEI